MKRLTFAAGVTICAATLAAGAVFAKPGGDRSPATFEQLDVDGDGQITRAEMEGLRARTMATADTDQDGALSLEEIEARAVERAKTRAQKMMERLDVNADGLLTAEEMKTSARMMRRFDRVDSNADGSISKAEFDAARERFAKRRPRAD